MNCFPTSLFRDIAAFSKGPPGEAEMSHHRSQTYSFDVESHGEVHACSFFISDDRLITVLVGDRKRTCTLGSTPPLALALSIATAELLPKEIQQHPHETGQHPHEMGLIAKLLHFGGNGEHACAHP
jgi:hypothetical protein